MLIGLGYKKRSGKDTVGVILRDMYSFKILSFATPLKELTTLVVDSHLNRIRHGVYDECLHRWARRYHLPVTSGAFQILKAPSSLADHLYEEEGGKYRKLLQFLGTDLIRGYSDSFWIDALKHQLPKVTLDRINTVVTDVRFPNEKAFIEEWGYAVLVDRDTGLKDEHSSETALDGHKWKYRIDNNGTLEELKAQVVDLVGEFY
jgi:hypothetical protein